MISAALNFLENYSLVINFICHLIIFLGGFYVAMHSRVLPRWATTCIWYIGVSSLLVSVTIVAEWICGQSYQLSHFMMGRAIEIVMNINLAIMVFMMFYHTVYHDIKNRSKRNSMKKSDDRLTL